MLHAISNWLANLSECTVHGMNNGTNNNVVNNFNASSFLGLSAALSQARIGKNSTTSDLRQGNQTGYHNGGLSAYNGYNFTNKAANKARSMRPKSFTIASARGNNGSGIKTDTESRGGNEKKSALKNKRFANANKGNVTSGSANYASDAFYAGASGAANTEERANKTDTNNTTTRMSTSRGRPKEKYRYDEPTQCIPNNGEIIETTIPSALSSVGNDFFYPSPVGASARGLTFFTSDEGKLEFAFGENCFPIDRSYTIVAKKMCDENEKQIIPVYISPVSHLWQPDKEGKKRIENNLNERMGNAVGLKFVYLDNENAPSDGIVIKMGFMGEMNFLGQANAQFLSNTWIDISTKTNVDSKYTRDYCMQNADENNGTWVIPNIDLDTDGTMETIYHEFFHALIGVRHSDYDVSNHEYTLTDENGHEKNCSTLQLKAKQMAFTKDGKTPTDTIMDALNTPSGTKNDGILTQDALVASRLIGFNKQYFTEKRQLGTSGVFGSVFNVSESAPIVSTKCNLADGYRTVSSPSKALVIIDARECFKDGKSQCGNCTSMLGEKPFDSNMKAREESMIRTPNDQSRGVTMFTATPQVTLFGSCNFVVNGLSRGRLDREKLGAGNVSYGNVSQPINIHASLHVSAPEEGMKKEYGNYETTLSYLISGHKNETTGCYGPSGAIPSGDSNIDQNIMKNINTVHQIMKTAVTEAYKSVGGDIGQQFLVGENIQDPETINIVIKFVDSQNKRLEECLKMKNCKTFSIYNVFTELDKIARAERGDPELVESELEKSMYDGLNVSKPNDISTPNEKEREVAQTIYNETAKNIDVSVKTNGTRQVALFGAGALGTAITSAMILLCISKVKKKMADRLGEDVEAEALNGDSIRTNYQKTAANKDSTEEIELTEINPKILSRLHSVCSLDELKEVFDISGTRQPEDYNNVGGNNGEQRNNGNNNMPEFKQLINNKGTHRKELRAKRKIGMGVERDRKSEAMHY